MADIQKIADDLSSLTVLEHQINKDSREKWGVSRSTCSSCSTCSWTSKWWW